MKANEEKNQPTSAAPTDEKVTPVETKTAPTEKASQSASADQPQAAAKTAAVVPAEKDKDAVAEKADATTAPASETASANAERNKQASAKQAKIRATRHINFKEISEMSIEELRAELTNKNVDYIFKIHKQLVDGGYTDADADAKIDTFLAEIIQAQRTGKPANQLYGPPTVKADLILHAPAKPITIKYWMRSLDWSLLYLVILAAVFGVMGFFTKTTSAASSSGLGTLIIMSVAFGFLLTWFTDNMPSARKSKDKQAAANNEDENKKKKPLWRVILLSVGGVFGVMILISFMTVLTPALNPILPAYGYFIVAAVSYGLRYLFRRHYHIKGRLM